MRDFRLVIRTPTAKLVDRLVHGATAEDRTGRFGVRPAMESLVVALVPSLLTYRVGAEEFLVAVGRGLLWWDQSTAHVSVRRAVLCSSFDAVEAEIEQATAADRSSDVAARGAFRSLFNRLQQSLVDEGRLR